MRFNIPNLEILIKSNVSGIILFSTGYILMKF